MTYISAHSLSCPLEKRETPRGVSIGGKRVSSAFVQGGGVVIFSTDMQSSHFEKEKLRRLKIQYQEFLSRDRLFVSFEYSRIFWLFFFA